MFYCVEENVSKIIENEENVMKIIENYLNLILFVAFINI